MGDEVLGSPPAAPPPAFRIEGDRAALFGALAKARPEFASLETNQTAEVEKDGRKLYSFDYADLATLQQATTGALSKHGLVLMQPWWSDGEGYVLMTMLAHASGASISTETWLPRQQDWQKLGSALSYLQRYQWRSILGISASKDDDDANAAVGNSGTQTRPRPAPQASRQPPPARPTGAITDAQLRDIGDIAKELGLNKAKGESIMKEVCGFVAPLEELPKADAQKLLVALVDMQKKGASNGAAPA